MIPTTLHYCWYGDRPRPERLDRYIATWHQAMPGWEVVEWNEANTPLDNAYCREAGARGLWAMVADYARLYALRAHGGIYLDTDVEVRRSLDPLRHHRCFVGFQDERPDADWVNNAVLGAAPAHPFVDMCLRLTLAYYERTGEFARSPTVTTEVLRGLGLREYGYQELSGVAVYPTRYFYPYPWYGEFSETCVSDDTYCVHHWERSWWRAMHTTQEAARGTAA